MLSLSAAVSLVKTFFFTVEEKRMSFDGGLAVSATVVVSLLLPATDLGMACETIPANET